MTELYRGLWVVAYRELLTFVSDRTRIVASLVFPILFLVIFGAGFGGIVGRMGGGVDLMTFMYPGIVAQSVLIASLFAGVSVVADRESGFLREILVAPLSRTGIVLGKAIGAAAVAMLQVLMLLVLAPIVGVRLDAVIVVQLVPIVLVLSFVLAGIGLLIASFAPTQQGFQLFMQMLVFPMIFLAGVFFPVDTVPAWMQFLSKINPATYGVDAIRQVFLGSGPAGAGLGVSVLGHTMTLAQEVLLIAVLAAAVMAAAAWRFGRQE